MPILIPAFAGAALATATDAITGSPILTFVALLLGSGAFTAVVNGWMRRQSGEGPASAADKLAAAAERIGEAGEALVTPYLRQNADLALQLSQARQRLADKSEELAAAQVGAVQAEAAATNERHQHANDVAALAAEIALKTALLSEAQQELETLRCQVDGTDRRARDRRNT